MTWGQRIRAFCGWYPAYTAEQVLRMPYYRFIALSEAALAETPGSQVELERAEAAVAEMRRLRAARRGTAGQEEQHDDADPQAHAAQERAQPG